MAKPNLESKLKDVKWMIITGGVLSGLGKGAATASIGRLMKNSSKIVTIKCDGYLNVDPGTMNPVEHGEVFVLDDGGEVDMDFGHYERFLDITCKSSWNLTSGKIFNQVIERERKGDYLGQTIQIFPHVIDNIKENFYHIALEENADIVMIEVGGTVGDIENSWFIEAARQLKNDFPRNNVIYTHLTYIPFLHNTGEPKTKPAQRDVALLREKGISPDILVCRSKEPLPLAVKQKLERMCDLEPHRIISGVDVSNIYEIPLMFEQQGMLNIIAEKFGIPEKATLGKWNDLVYKINNPSHNVTIAICGKYTDLKDSYASILESLVHAGAHLNAMVNVKWIETSNLDNISQDLLSSFFDDVNGIIVPGGFGTRGTEGKINVIRYARENNIPFLGICYGMQLAVVEYARNICNLTEANSSEINPNTPYPVITLMNEQFKVTNKGGTMRLGAYPANLTPGSLAHKLYKSLTISERHRHRYEVNPEYHNILHEHGLVLSGMSPDKNLVEFIELPQHKYFIATQSHPELKSRLEKPAPLFYGLVKASLDK